MSSETAGACLPYSLSRCFAILGKRGGSIPIFLVDAPAKTWKRRKTKHLLSCSVSGLVSPGSRARSRSTRQ